MSLKGYHYGLALIVMAALLVLTISDPLEIFKPQETKLYEQWMNGYLEKGGAPTTAIDSPAASYGQWVIAEDQQIFKRSEWQWPPKIIVPKGTRIYVIGDPSKIPIFYMENFTCTTEGTFVPIFRDLALPSAAQDRKLTKMWHALRDAFESTSIHNDLLVMSQEYHEEGVASNNSSLLEHAEEIDGARERYDAVLNEYDNIKKQKTREDIERIAETN